MVESIAKAYCEDKGIRFVSCRYFTVYGPGDKKAAGVVPTALRALLAGKPFRCESPENRWDFVYIDDAIEATVNVLMAELEGEVDIASGMPMRMRDALMTIGKVLGCPEKLTFNDRQEKRVDLLADTSRLKKLGFSPRISFSEGINKMINWLCSVAEYGVHNW